MAQKRTPPRSYLTEPIPLDLRPGERNNDKGMRDMHSRFVQEGMITDHSPRVKSSKDPIGETRARMRKEYPDQDPNYVRTPKWLAEMLKGKNAIAAALGGQVFYTPPDPEMGMDTLSDIMAHELRHLKGDQPQTGETHYFDMPREQSSYFEEQKRREARMRQR